MPIASFDGVVRAAADRRAIMIGYAPWDVTAAAKGGATTIAVLAGGYSLALRAGRYGADELAGAADA
ncbi:MAG: hypothetical protein JWN61_2984 [Pseudonocardiales bacterium]|nr:hypothetical protein [Jatrophihabitantaceae bacterium]MCW2604849.1 hypothetical protein [Pseudonocardiales bacterium]